MITRKATVIEENKMVQYRIILRWCHRLLFSRRELATDLRLVLPRLKTLLRLIRSNRPSSGGSPNILPKPLDVMLLTRKILPGFIAGLILNTIVFQSSKVTLIFLALPLGLSGQDANPLAWHAF